MKTKEQKTSNLMMILIVFYFTILLTFISCQVFAGNQDKAPKEIQTTWKTDGKIIDVFVYTD